MCIESFTREMKDSTNTQRTCRFRFLLILGMERISWSGLFILSEDKTNLQFFKC